MKQRIQVLILYKVLLLSLLSIYQLLSLLLDLEASPFVISAYSIAFLSLVSVLSYGLLVRFTWSNNAIRNIAFIQFLSDIIFITHMLLYTGGEHSLFRFLYLAVIMLSATFFEKVVLYAVTAISISAYFSAIITLKLWGDASAISTLSALEPTAEDLRVQFVLCFGSSLLASFMQSFYRSTRFEVKVKNEEVQRLQRTRQKIIETLPSGLLTTHSDGTLLFINEIGRKYLSLPDTAVRDKINIFELLNLKIYSETSHQTRVERTLAIEGVSKSFGVSYCPMELDRSSSGFLVVFQDLTKIKMLEAQNQLQDRMAAIGKMAAGVAHEIRNPLASISGSTQVIREVIQEDEEIAELADIVVTETKRLDSIISSFLAYARPGPPPNPEPIELVDFSLHFIRLVENDPKMKGFPLDYLGLDEVYILGDTTRLSQIYWNLVRNAHQACDQENGQIQISICRVSDKVELKIKDNGIGMSEAQVKDVFTPFQSFREKGTGLGMAVVYENVRVHDGEISVQSKLNEGTEVSIMFPEYRK